MSDARQALERLAKWRTLFAGWQLGTRAKGNPEADAVRDHREATIMLRAEMSALGGLLIKKGIITAEEFDASLEIEALQLSRDYEQRFPGVIATGFGLTIDPAKAQGWLKHWRP